eukprot:XP_763915.1 hypothetical protein [Theileria parva strain Muguga]
MSKFINIVFYCNLKYILLILFLFHFIYFTESVISNNRHGINLNNSFYQTKSRYHFNSKQNKLLCFLSNNSGCLNNFSKTTNTFVPNIPFNIKHDSNTELYGFTHYPNFNHTPKFKPAYNRINPHTNFPVGLNNLPIQPYYHKQNIPFNMINYRNTYQQNGFNMYSRKLNTHPLVPQLYGSSLFAQSHAQIPWQQPIHPINRFNFQLPLQNSDQTYEPNSPLQSVKLQRKEEKLEAKKLRYFSFKLRDDLIWINDDEDNWPGTKRIKPGETYQGVIHYFFTPYEALVYLADKKVEGSVSIKDMPPDFSDLKLSELFKPDHLMSFRLKEPQEFDEKGRPKFVISLDPQIKKITYKYKSRVRGRPIFVTNTMAIFKLEDGENYAQVFLVNTGVYLTFPIKLKMTEIFKNDEIVELEVLNKPIFPRIVGYLCRIPFDSPTGLELRSKYRMVYDISPEDKNEFVTTEKDEISEELLTMQKFISTEQGVTTENKQPVINKISQKICKTFDEVPHQEPDECTLREYVKELKGNLKFILKYILLKTKIIINPSVRISQKMAKILRNLIIEKREFHITDEEEAEELNKLHNSENSPIHSRKPVVAILGGTSSGKTSLFSSLCGVKPDPNTNYNFGTAEHKYPATLLDTPANGLLSPIRDNMLKESDIALILISADTGVTKETEESIKQCKKLNKPFIFVLTKFDMSTQSTIEDVATKLADIGCELEHHGGKYEMILYSTLNDTESSKNSLMETILINSLESSDMLLEKPDSANSDGYIIDVGKNETSGCYALILVKNGELRKGDYISSAINTMRVKSLKDKNGEDLVSVKPSEIGFAYGFSKDSTFDTGMPFQSFSTKKQADLASDEKIRVGLAIIDQVRQKTHKTFQNMDPENFTYAYAIIRAELKSVVEIIKTEIEKMRSYGINNTWRYKVLDARMSKITQKDVSIFKHPGIALLYNYKISNTLKKKLSEKNITVVEGEKLDDIVDMAKEELRKIAGEKRLGILSGKAQILKVFEASKKKNAAGCLVTYGTINPYLDVRIIREDRILFNGKISSLRRTKEEASEICEGETCGITLENFNDFKVGDVIEAYSD